MSSLFSFFAVRGPQHAEVADRQLLQVYSTARGDVRAEHLDSHSLTIVQRRRELESQALIEDEERKSYEKIRMQCEMDTYSLLLLRFVQWWDGDSSMVFWTKHGEFKGRFRPIPTVAFVHAVVLFVMAAALQVLIVFMLYENSRATMHKWTYYDEHSGISLHEAGMVLNGALARGDPDLGLAASSIGIIAANTTKLGEDVRLDCLSTRKVEYLTCYFCVMLLWVAKLMPEFRQVKTVFRSIWCMEVRQDKSMPLLEADGDTILRLDWWLQALLLLVIPCVRLIVATLVAIAGIDFITAQDTTGNIVLKALCMQFVTDIDNLFLIAFTSEGGRDRVSRMRLFIPPEKFPCWTIAPDWWDNGLGGLVYISIGVCVVILSTGVLGRASMLGDFGIVKYNLMYFRYTCQNFCMAFPDSCLPVDIRPP